MDTKALIKATLIIGLFSGALLLGWYQFFSPRSNPVNTLATINNGNDTGWKFPLYEFIPSGQVTDSDAYSQLRKTGDPKGLPNRLIIPSIGVDTRIEDAYITPGGLMDVPANSVNVAWFALGPRPGQIGSSVIGGHYGIDNGKPKVFYRLNDLRAGDKVLVQDDRGETTTFIVRSIQVFKRTADSTPVFISRDNMAHLNLITCDGVWNKVNDSYPDRRVIFTDAVAADSREATTPDTTITPGLPLAGDESDTKQTTILENMSKNPLVAALTLFAILTIVFIFLKTILRR